MKALPIPHRSSWRARVPPRRRSRRGAHSGAEGSAGYGAERDHPPPAGANKSTDASTEDSSPEAALAREQATELAISRFAELAPPQRSAVILKDVLDHSVEEVAGLLDLGVPAVKASLHRGRKRLAQRALEAPLETQARRASPGLTRFVTLFNARDWDALRAQLASEAQTNRAAGEVSNQR